MEIQLMLTPIKMILIAICDKHQPMLQIYKCTTGMGKVE